MTAATLAAQLKGRMRICVIDCRDHLGGNCFDHACEGTLIHDYGPHIFHCPSPRIVSFLNSFTDWVPYSHRVTAEILHEGSLRQVPFPYSTQTVRNLGRELTAEEIINSFFRGYSKKMWGMDWEDLPSSIRGRIPMEAAEAPRYYRDRFVALPRRGYTHMMENMLDGVEIILGAASTEWTHIKAKTIVYTGRPDLIPVPSEALTIGEQLDLQLGFRTLEINFGPEVWPHESVSLHACSLRRPWTRKTSFARMTGGSSPLISTETPRQATDDELTPYYPIELPANHERFARLRAHIGHYYPTLHLAGRLGTYRYFDMYQVIGQSLALAKRL